VVLSTGQQSKRTLQATLRKDEGVPDFVLLDQLTEEALYANLVLRYKKKQIYTCDRR
jgi:myosin heavy subunit